MAGTGRGCVGCLRLTAIPVVAANRPSHAPVAKDGPQGLARGRHRPVALYTYVCILNSEV